MEKSPITTILVPVDGSKNAYKALEYAEKLGLGTNATIDVLHVVDTHCEAEIDLSPLKGPSTVAPTSRLFPCCPHSSMRVPLSMRHAGTRPRREWAPRVLSPLAMYLS